MPIDSLSPKNTASTQSNPGVQLPNPIPHYVPSRACLVASAVAIGTRLVGCAGPQEHEPGHVAPTVVAYDRNVPDPAESNDANRVGATQRSLQTHSSSAPNAPRLSDLPVPWQANNVMVTLRGIHENRRSGGYSSMIRVDEEQGMYAFDCSGMTQWVLRRAAPRAAAASAYKLPHRPLARDFYRRIASVPAGKERFGWRRVQRVADARAGDVVAWVKPDIIQSRNTGHVAFILLPPVAVPGYDNAYLVRIADSSRLLHDEDTRTNHDGFGFGTILLLSDPDTGEPTAYGWAGLRWRTFETQIAIGRPTE